MGSHLHALFPDPAFDFGCQFLLPYGNPSALIESPVFEFGAKVSPFTKRRYNKNLMALAHREIAVTSDEPD